MGDDWAETRMQWGRLKKSLAGLWRQLQLERAQRHGVKAVAIYGKNGQPQTAYLLAQAMLHSFEEDRKP